MQAKPKSRRDKFSSVGPVTSRTSNVVQLSKKHHPDVSNDPKSKEIYTAVSAAYSILVDDRERRAYDRKMQYEDLPTSANPPYPYESRFRRRAFHAWRKSRPPPPPRSSQSTADPSSRTTYQSKQDSQNSRTNTSYTHANAATDGDKSMFRRRTEALHREREKVEKISGSIRALQVFLVLIVIAGLAAPTMSSSIVVNRPTYLSSRPKLDEEFEIDTEKDSSQARPNRVE
ncbi:hypothetical protein BDP27DRAFT_1421425 [Rhodocollybia butyracea]|uniref:J domain-containing protein n=1 Tax=Rhodocollybia butyracea TaxID=206335 RepID=A0A9P5PN70_9AGAR|nr:hypothetical protein BDP27DRAFT_1421425 [Rhodocollybia butyracea]